MADGTGHGGSDGDPVLLRAGATPTGRPMGRRGFVGALGALTVSALAGCLGGGGDRGTTTTTLDPSRVTTTGGDGVEVLAAQMVVREADAGPRVRYRLRDDGGTDATVAVRTVLAIEAGGTYEATA